MYPSGSTLAVGSDFVVYCIIGGGCNGKEPEPVCFGQNKYVSLEHDKRIKGLVNVDSDRDRRESDIDNGFECNRRYIKKISGFKYRKAMKNNPKGLGKLGKIVFGFFPESKCSIA